MPRRPRKYSPRIAWKNVRRTAKGRSVDHGEIMSWNEPREIARSFVRHRIAAKIRTCRPDHYHYNGMVDFGFRFYRNGGWRQGTLDVVFDPRTMKKRFPHPITFRGIKAFRRDLNMGTWLLYMTIIRDLCLGNNGRLPSYSRRFKGGRRRTYRDFWIHIRLERIRRKRGKRA